VPLDPEVETAIHEAAHAIGQPDKVAKRLISWLKAMSEGELQSDRDLDHLEALKQAIVLEADKE
jgi:hypothetical protein